MPKISALKFMVWMTLLVSHLAEARPPTVIPIRFETTDSASKNPRIAAMQQGIESRLEAFASVASRVSYGELGKRNLFRWNGDSSILGRKQLTIIFATNKDKELFPSFVFSQKRICTSFVGSPTDRGVVPISVVYFVDRAEKLAQKTTGIEEYTVVATIHLGAALFGFVPAILEMSTDDLLRTSTEEDSMRLSLSSEIGWVLTTEALAHHPAFAPFMSPFLGAAAYMKSYYLEVLGHLNTGVKACALGFASFSQQSEAPEERILNLLGVSVVTSGGPGGN